MGRYPDMLLPKNGVSWKAARSSLPPTRAIWALLARKRFLLLIALVGSILFLWRGIRGSASEMQRFDFPDLVLMPPGI